MLQDLEQRAQSAAHRAPAPAPSTQKRTVLPADIHQVIDRRQVRTLFQPVVLLSTAAVVGFEALSRGPEGTDLEAPNVLFEAARQAGRLGELDWVCRTAALQLALDSSLHPSVSWFINVEPAGLACPCPDDLQAVQARARSGLRVVLELTERDSDGYVVNLLHAAEQARESTWGVALDDVGTEAMSLALLPFLQPDVVKLDMKLVADLPPAAAAAVTAAVRAYAERSGAVILAEGVETKEQERLAVVFGATYAQGWLYARPGPLPETVPVPREAIPLRQTSPRETDQTPFELAKAERPSRRAAKHHLLHISEYLEQQGRQALEASVLLACFQRAEFFTGRRQTEYLELSTVNAFTVAVGEGFPEQMTSRYQLGGLDTGNRLAREWVVIVLGPHYSAAMVARDCGEVGLDANRSYDFVYTHDRDLVVRIARSFLYHSANPQQVLADGDGPRRAVVSEAGPSRPAAAESAPVAQKSRWRRG